MQQTDYNSRLQETRQAMKKAGLKAIVLEGGASMMFLSGVRWGRSERTFSLVLPADGGPVWVVPGFEVLRARELIGARAEIRAWEEDESPFEKIAQALKDRGVASGRVGIADDVRFFVFDGIRAKAPQLELVSAGVALKAVGL